MSEDTEELSDSLLCNPDDMQGSIDEAHRRAGLLDCTVSLIVPPGRYVVSADALDVPADVRLVGEPPSGEPSSIRDCQFIGDNQITWSSADTNRDDHA